MAHDGAETYHTVIATPEGLRDKFVIAYRHAECLLKNGDRVEIKVAPALETISVKQRAFLHGPVLTQISEQAFVGPERTRYTSEIWKEFFHRRFIPDRWVMKRLPGAKRATPHRERVSSETLGVQRYSQWIDQIIDYAVVEHGVIFEFKEGEREAVRVVAKRRTGSSQ